MGWDAELGYVEDQAPAPLSYEEQVALAESWGVPQDQIQSIVGTPESVAASNQAAAQSVADLTGQAPSWAQDVGYNAPPPSWLRPEDYTSAGYAAPYTAQEIAQKVAAENIRYGYNNTPYASVRGISDLSGGEYVVNPDTGRFVLDQSGNPIPVPRPNLAGYSFGTTFDDVVLPLAIAAMSAPVLGGLGGELLAGAGGLGATGEAAVAAQSLTGNTILDAALAGAGKGAITGGVTSALTGQDALKGALIGGATGGLLGGGESAFAPGAAEWAKGSVTNSGLLGAGRGAAGGVLNTLLGGGDLQKNVLYNAIGGGAIGAGTEYFSPTAPSQFGTKPGEAPRWASVQDSLENARQSADYFNNLKYGDVSNMGYAGQPYSGEGLNPAARTGGGYDVLNPDYITNRGGYGVGGYKGVGLDPAIEQLYGGVGLNPNLNYNTAGLANTAEALSQASGVDINRAEFAGRGGLTADQEAALDRALTAADYPTASNWFSGLGNLGALLGMGALGRGAGGGGAGKAGVGAGGSFVPKGMVDYAGILNLLAPKTSTRSSLLG